ncbi:MAG: hypothetical protein IJY62_04785 [Clostridia bacterium]|nr:hypothetical protein [Clostridia bacterium]
MSIKPHFETYRYTTELCKVNSQSIVECRLPGGEISSILAVYAHAVPTECTCGDGEVRYGGKLLINVVYEDSERKVCRAERGAEFTHRAQEARVVPAAFASVRLTADNVTKRREGSALYLSVIVGAEITVYGNAEAEYLYDGEGLITKKGSVPIVKTIVCSGETELEDDFETDYVGDILLHSETPAVGSVSAEAGQIVLSGEVSLNLCAMKSDSSLCSYERLIPYRMEIPCDESLPKLPASARVSVLSAVLTAGADEDRGKCKMTAQLVLRAECELFVRDELPAAADVYSTAAEIGFKTEKREGKYVCELVRFTERIGGTASLSVPIDYTTSLQAAVLPRAEIACRQGENGGEAEGAVFAEVILCDGDGVHKSAELSLPFLFPVSFNGAAYAEAEATVCGLSVRQRREGEAEVEATLKVTVKLFKEETAEFISEVEEGEAFEENHSAISIYVPQEGDDLWETAKKLRRTPEEVAKSNPDLEFPVKKGERIFVYRRKV